MRPALVALDRLVGGGHGGDREAGDLDRLAVVDARPARGPTRSAASARCASGATSVDAGQRAQRVGVEVVGVRVRGGHDVDEAEPGRVDDELGHAHVRLVGVRVLARQRVGEVRVEQQVPPLPGHEEAALAQPPEVEAAAGGPHVGEERLAGAQRADHGAHDPVPLTAMADGIVFTGERLDRAAERRADARLARRAGARARSRAPCWPATPASTSRPATSRASRCSRSRASTAAEPLLLGLDASGPVFAVDAEPSANGAAPSRSPPNGEGAADPATGTRALGLRAAAASLPQADAGLAAHAAALVNWHRRHRHCSVCGARDRRGRGRDRAPLPELRHRPPPAHRPGGDHARHRRRPRAARPPADLAGGPLLGARGLRRAGREPRGGGRPRGARGGGRRGRPAGVLRAPSRGRSRAR